MVWRLVFGGRIQVKFGLDADVPKATRSEFSSWFEVAHRKGMRLD